MKECPECGRSYDDSWRVCLFCGERLVKTREQVGGELSIERDKFPGNKLLIVVFSVFLMLLTPVVIFVLYAAYFQALDSVADRHEKKQLQKTIVFDEEEESEEKGRSKTK